MSEENVEIVRRNYDHLSKTGEPLADVCDEEIEFSFAWMEGRGFDGLQQATAEWTSTFEEWHIEARELIEVAPDQVIAIVRDRARAKGSNAEIDNEFAHLWTLRDGLIIRFGAFTERAEALEAAGVRE
jgi:ketosteroid isomerase-like protein